MQALHRALQRLAVHERARLVPTLLRSVATHATLGEAEIDEPADDNRPTTPWIRTGLLSVAPALPVITSLLDPECSRSPASCAQSCPASTWFGIRSTTKAWHSVMRNESGSI